MPCAYAWMKKQEGRNDDVDRLHLIQAHMFRQTDQITIFSLILFWFSLDATLNAVVILDECISCNLT